MTIMFIIKIWFYENHNWQFPRKITKMYENPYSLRVNNYTNFSASSLKAVTFKSQVSSWIVKLKSFPEPLALFHSLICPLNVIRPKYFTFRLPEIV